MRVSLLTLISSKAKIKVFSRCQGGQFKMLPSSTLCFPGTRTYLLKETGISPSLKDLQGAKATSSIYLVSMLLNLHLQYDFSIESYNLEGTLTSIQRMAKKC